MKSKKKVKGLPDYLDDSQLLAEKIGERIKQLRLRNGHTSQEKFANEFSLDRAQFSRYERGEADMRVSTLARIWKALDVTPQEFFSEGF